MKLKYLRISVFYALLRPYQQKTRKKRMRRYMTLMNLKEGMSVLDLGGLPRIWDSVADCLNLTILNLPGSVEPSAPSHHRIRYVEGDACQVREVERRSFDSVFSNSVIEHVGSVDKQAAFASEVRRLGKSYWVQTPARWFPIEAHCGMPFWWFYPSGIRRWLVESWRKKLPEWTEMVESTTVLTKKQMRRLFPEATVITERSFGFPKSYIAYFTGATAAVGAPRHQDGDAARPLMSSGEVVDNEVPTFARR